MIAPRSGESTGSLLRFNRLFALAFVAVALPTLVYLATMLPLGQAPDEATQIARAASVVHGQVIGQRVMSTHPDGTPFMVSGVMLNVGYLDALLRLPQTPTNQRRTVTSAELARSAAAAWGNGLVFADASNTAGYMPIFFLPPAFAMGLAHLAGAGPADADFAGRLACAAFYLVVGAAALLIAVRGGAILLALLLLPMSLHLAAAVHQDGPLIATAALAAALLGRADMSRLGPAVYWAGVGALACVIAAKPPYLPLAAAALLPMGQNAWRGRRQLIGCACAAVPGLLWAAWAVRSTSTNFMWPDYLPGPLWPGDPSLVFRGTDPAAQWAVALAHPGVVAAMPFTTLQQQAGRILRQLVGWLSYLDVPLPEWLYQGWFWALGCVIAAHVVGAGRARGPRAPAALMLLAAGVLVVYLVYLAQYATWTRVGATAIEGVQGRYFIPVLMLMSLALPTWPIARRLAGVLAMAPVVAGVIGFAVIPVVITAQYFLQ